MKQDTTQLKTHVVIFKHNNELQELYIPRKKTLLEARAIVQEFLNIEEVEIISVSKQDLYLELTLEQLNKN